MADTLVGTTRRKANLGLIELSIYDLSYSVDAAPCRPLLAPSAHNSVEALLTADDFVANMVAARFHKEYLTQFLKRPPRAIMARQFERSLVNAGASPEDAKFVSAALVPEGGVHAGDRVWCTLHDDAASTLEVTIQRADADDAQRCVAMMNERRFGSTEARRPSRRLARPDPAPSTQQRAAPRVRRCPRSCTTA